MSNDVKVNLQQPISLYRADSTDKGTLSLQRQRAVEAVLEIVRAKALSGALQATIHSELKDLSKNADLIERALETTGASAR